MSLNLTLTLYTVHCTGRHRLRLGVIRIYMSMLAPVGGVGGGGGGNFCRSHKSYCNRSGSRAKLFVSRQQTGVHVSSGVFLVRTGANFPGAGLIHGVHQCPPRLVGGVPQAAPPGMTFWRSWWATDFFPQGKGGFRIPIGGDTNPAVYWRLTHI